MKRREVVGIVVAVLIAVAAVIVLICFWPDEKSQRSLAVFSYLQFVVTLVLALLTFLYVSATNDLVASQNKPPSIRVSKPRIRLLEPESLFEFDVTIANRSIGGTIVEVESVTVARVRAKVLRFKQEGHLRNMIAVQAGQVLETSLEAFFDGIPYAPGTKSRIDLLFQDVVHGRLPIVSIFI